MVNVFHAQIGQVEILWRIGLISDGVHRPMERTDHVWPDGIRIAQHKRMDPALKRRSAKGEDVDAIVVVQIMRVGIQIAAEQRVFLG